MLDLFIVKVAVIRPIERVVIVNGQLSHPIEVNSTLPMQTDGPI